LARPVASRLQQTYGVAYIDAFGSAGQRVPEGKVGIREVHEGLEEEKYYGRVRRIGILSGGFSPLRIRRIRFFALRHRGCEERGD
jgi:hypothetical protein